MTEIKQSCRTCCWWYEDAEQREAYYGDPPGRCHWVLRNLPETQHNTVVMFGDQGTNCPVWKSL